MTKVAHPVTTECWTAGAGACDQLLIQSKVILCWAWYSKVLEKENKRLFNVKCAPRAKFWLPPSRVALWVEPHVRHVTPHLTSRFLRNFGPFATASCSRNRKTFGKVKKFKMLKTFALLFCLSVTLGEYFFGWHSFMWGYFYAIMGPPRFCCELSMLKKAPFLINGPSLF